jgi:DNA modification methylase
MGSGTTAMACIAEKRKFTGSELNKEYYELATKRIELELSQPKLF